jgi:hypothetical protein
MRSFSPLVSLPELPIQEPSVRAAFARLLGEFECAASLARTVWDFALELPRLRQTGLSDACLRALIAAGHVDHRVEQTPRARHRSFRTAAGAPWPKRSRFVLTAAGARLARQLLQQGRLGLTDGVGPVGAAGNGTPYWDAGVRDLWYRHSLVKHFRREAPNQEHLLDAFQELGWPQRMDDPLPRHAGVDSRDRLRDTVKSLNRCQVPLVLHFEVEVTGLGVRWRGVDS